MASVGGGVAEAVDAVERANKMVYGLFYPGGAPGGAPTIGMPTPLDEQKPMVQPLIGMPPEQRWRDKALAREVRARWNGVCHVTFGVVALLCFMLIWRIQSGTMLSQQFDIIFGIPSAQYPASMANGVDSGFNGSAPSVVTYPLPTTGQGLLIGAAMAYVAERLLCGLVTLANPSGWIWSPFKYVWMDNYRAKFFPCLFEGLRISLLEIFAWAFFGFHGGEVAMMLTAYDFGIAAVAHRVAEEQHKYLMARQNLTAFKASLVKEWFASAGIPTSDEATQSLTEAQLQKAAKMVDDVYARWFARLTDPVHIYMYNRAPLAGGKVPITLKEMRGRVTVAMDMRMTLMNITLPEWHLIVYAPLAFFMVFMKMYSLQLAFNGMPVKPAGSYGMLAILWVWNLLITGIFSTVLMLLFLHAVRQPGESPERALKNEAIKLQSAQFAFGFAHTFTELVMLIAFEAIVVGSYISQKSPMNGIHIAYAGG